MTEVDRKLAASLWADNTELIPYLPYLLQDLWEMGANPDDVVEIIKKNVPHYKELKALDLACGKGAVAIKLAISTGISIKGVDIVPEFVEYASLKAKELEVSSKAHFEVNDINKVAGVEQGYGLVLLGAAGDILGGRANSLKKIVKSVVKGGYSIICDSLSYDSEAAPTKKQWLQIFADAGFKLVAEKASDESYIIGRNNFNQDCIVQRAWELALKYPDKAELFADYVDAQQREAELMESELTGVTFLLQRV